MQRPRGADEPAGPADDRRIDSEVSPAVDFSTLEEAHRGTVHATGSSSRISESGPLARALHPRSQRHRAQVHSARPSPTKRQHHRRSYPLTTGASTEKTDLSAVSRALTTCCTSPRIGRLLMPAVSVPSSGWGRLPLHVGQGRYIALVHCGVSSTAATTVKRCSGGSGFSTHHRAGHLDASDARTRPVQGRVGDPNAGA